MIMKKFSDNTMVTIKGSGWGDFADGVCWAAGGLSLGALVFKSALRLTPVGAGVLIGVDVACLIYEGYKHS